LDDPPVFLSLIIPAHDEERRLPATFDRIREYLDRQPYRAEVLVVENASSDRTWEIANDAAARDSRFRVLREPIRGKGAAVKRGMLAARGEYRFLCDADLSMPIAEVESFRPDSGTPTSRSGHERRKEPSATKSPADAI
jgi:glycosyltransferase involved in cell wall biosynthesis